MAVFGKLFGGFGNKNKAEELNDNNYIETIIGHSEDKPLGISEKNVIYAGYNELGGYYYLQTYIIGALKVKTKTGAKLLIEGDNYSLDLNADMDEFESEPTDIFKGFATKIDFEIEKNAIDKIKRSTIKQLILTTKKEKIIFSIYTKDKNITD